MTGHLLHGKTEHFLSSALQIALLVKLSASIIGEQRRICGRIIGIYVDAVEDSRKFERVFSDNVFQTVRILRRFDFLRVCRADRRKLLRALDRPFHQIQTALIFQKVT